MSSSQPPSLVSFHGLAEILKEFREFIKDVTYRNRHERIKGELDLLHRIQEENGALVLISDVEQKRIAGKSEKSGTLWVALSISEIRET